MATSESQIQSIREMCASLASNPAIKDAYINDWGRFGNFEIFVVPNEIGRKTNGQLIRLVKEALPEGALYRQCFRPDRIRVLECGVVKSVLSRNFWSFDIDFMVYDEVSNRFS